MLTAIFHFVCAEKLSILFDICDIYLGFLYLRICLLYLGNPSEKSEKQHRTILDAKGLP